MAAFPKRQLPPLQDPKILKKIFQGSSLSDVKIGSGPDGKGKSDRRLKAFMVLVNNEMCTLTKDSFPNSVAICGGDASNEGFWERFGNLIKSLQLESVKCSIEDFRDAIYHYCPNLEELSMTNVGVGPFVQSLQSLRRRRFPDNAKMPPIDDPRHQVENRKLKYLRLNDINCGRYCYSHSFFEELFDHFRNIETLDSTRCKWESGHGAVLSALSHWLRSGHGRGKKLKEVHLSLSWGGAAEILASESLALVNLDLADIKWSTDWHAFQMILKRHATSLQKLSLKGNRDENHLHPLDLYHLRPELTLEKLEELHLSIVFNPINLWKCVPSLKKLVLDFMPLGVVAGDGAYLQKLQKSALPNCVELEYREGSVKVKRALPGKLAVLFPNLKILKLDSFEKEVFTIACQSFPKLVELSVVAKRSRPSRKDLESVLTGLEKDAVERINREGKSGTWKPTTQPKTGLPNLKELKILSIRSHKSLGYSSAIHGIELLPALEQLHLDFEEVDEGTWNAVWKPLLAKFPWKGK